MNPGLAALRQPDKRHVGRAARLQHLGGLGLDATGLRIDSARRETFLDKEKPAAFLNAPPTARS